MELTGADETPDGQRSDWEKQGPSHRIISSVYPAITQADLSG
jgi:hypothetical protein